MFTKENYAEKKKMQNKSERRIETKQSNPITNVKRIVGRYKYKQVEIVLNLSSFFFFSR